jgi:hypothetical protein
MCEGRGWKSTGDKNSLVKRLVKKLKALLKGEEGTKSLIESKIGPTLGADGPPAQVRRFYADNFQAVDRFDREWYEIQFNPGARNWVSHFCWSLIHSAILNARAAWCAINARRVTSIEFLSLLVASYTASLRP